MDIKEKIEGLRAELHRHNYNYYVLNAPEISDKEFDEKIRELQDLEQAHPEYKDENSPTMRVGSDINKNFTQVAHKYPMLSLATHIRRRKSPISMNVSVRLLMKILRFAVR